MGTLSEHLRSKPVIWIGGLALLALLFYLRGGRINGDGRPDCDPPPVAPRANADGTVDHVIIQKCAGMKGEYIILRFPADQKLIVSEKMAPTKVGMFGGPSVILSGSPNDYVSATYDLSKGWKPVLESEYMELSKNHVTVDINFGKWSNDNVQTTLKGDAKDIETVCDPPIRHSNGLLEYRLKKGRDPQAFPPCFGSYLSTDTVRTYVSANPLAIFNCTAPLNNGGDTGFCYGAVDTPEPVSIVVNFRTTAEPTPQFIADALPHILQSVKKVFVGSGELQPNDVFSFEKFAPSSSQVNSLVSP